MSGRYAKLMGEHWRTRAAKVSLAANGLWANARSYIADNATDGVVHETFLAGLCGGKTDKRAVSELVDAGWWEPCEGGYLDVSYLDENISRARAEELRDGVAARVAKSRAKKRDTTPPDNDGGNGPGNGSRNDESNGECNALRLAFPSDTKTPRHQDPAPSEHGVQGGAPAPPSPPVPDPSVRISELSSRYPAELVTSAYEVCARHRKTGRIADSVWLATLEKLDAFAPELVVSAMKVFVDRYATGEHGESYLLGIVRNERERGTRKSGWRAPTTKAEYAESGTSQAELGSLFGSVTDDDRARVERIGSRRAHG